MDWKRHCRKKEGGKQKPGTTVPHLQGQMTNSFNKCILSTYYVPGPGVSPGNTEVTEVSKEITFSWGETN